jgi:hypothetical protein
MAIWKNKEGFPVVPAAPDKDAEFPPTAPLAPAMPWGAGRVRDGFVPSTGAMDTPPGAPAIDGSAAVGSGGPKNKG